MDTKILNLTGVIRLYITVFAVDNEDMQALLQYNCDMHDPGSQRGSDEQLSLANPCFLRVILRPNFKKEAFSHSNESFQES